MRPEPVARGDPMKKRVISCIVLILSMLVCLFLSKWTRLLFFTLAGLFCAYEYSHGMEDLDVHCSLWVLVVYLIGQALLAGHQFKLTAGSVWFIGCVYLALLSGILRQRVKGNGALDTVAGLTYPCMLFGVLLYISVTEIWLETVAIACLASWTCDSFALFGGTRFGKHKVAPAISPNKTVEGCICGALASLVAGLLVWLIGKACGGTFLGNPYQSFSLGLCLFTAFFSSTLGQMGDLVESLIKRMIGIKDFSDLIPGHGGMFDRADSLLFAIPTAYFCIKLYLGRL